MYKTILIAVDGSEHIINIRPEKLLKFFRIIVILIYSMI